MKRPPRPKLVTEIRFHQLAFGQAFKFYTGLDLVLVRDGLKHAKYEQGSVEMSDAYDARVHPMPLPKWFRTPPPRASAVLPTRSAGWGGFLVHLMKKKLQGGSK